MLVYQRVVTTSPTLFPSFLHQNGHILGAPATKSRQSALGRLPGALIIVAAAAASVAVPVAVPIAMHLRRRILSDTLGHPGSAEEEKHIPSGYD